MIFRPSKMRVLARLPNALVLTHGSRRNKAIYLTFDDGPDPLHTPVLLDLLKAHEAKASFFLIGRQAERYPQLVERMVAEGHSIGNHSYSHPMFNTLSISQKLAEIDRTDQLLSRFDGVRHHRFRPPRGAFSLALTLRFAASRRNLAYWSYDSLDYQRKPAPELVDLLRRQPPQAGDILLMHDDSDCSAQMLAMLIPEWKADGYTFAALPA